MAIPILRIILKRKDYYISVDNDGSINLLEAFVSGQCTQQRCRAERMACNHSHAQVHHSLQITEALMPGLKISYW
jgi:hypothetical protein